MKRVYWGLGILLTVMLCLGQLQAVHAAKPPTDKRKEVTVVWYRRHKSRTSYVMARTDEQYVETDGQGYYYFRANPSPGYRVIYWKAGATTYRNTLEARVNVRRNSHISIYEEAIPPVKQTVEYMVRLPESNYLENYKTNEVWAEYGQDCRVAIDKPPAGFSLDSVRWTGGLYGGDSILLKNVTSENTIRVIWERKHCYVQFHPEGGEGTMERQAIYHEYPMKLSPNLFTRKGYRFDCWWGALSGHLENYSDRQTVRMKVTENGTEFNLYARWKPLFENLSLEYWDLEDNRLMECSGDYKVNEIIRLSENTAKEKATFIGWSVKKRGDKADCLEKKEYESQDLFEKGEKAGTIKKSGGKVTLPLYGIWDYAPRITVSKVLIPEGWAKEGKVTSDFLKQFVKVEDKEDGNEPGNGVHISGYNPDSFLNAKANDELVLWVETVDKSGNYAKEKLQCKIVGAKRKHLGRKGKIRFVNNEYKETLSENSVWRCRKTYWETLLKVLAK